MHILQCNTFGFQCKLGKLFKNRRTQSTNRIPASNSLISISAAVCTIALIRATCDIVESRRVRSSQLVEQRIEESKGRFSSCEQFVVHEGNEASKSGWAAGSTIHINLLARARISVPVACNNEVVVPIERNIRITSVLWVEGERRRKRCCIILHKCADCSCLIGPLRLERTETTTRRDDCPGRYAAPDLGGDLCAVPCELRGSHRRDIGAACRKICRKDRSFALVETESRYGVTVRCGGLQSSATATGIKVSESFHVFFQGYGALSVGSKKTGICRMIFVESVSKM